MITAKIKDGVDYEAWVRDYPQPWTLKKTEPIVWQWDCDSGQMFKSTVVLPHPLSNWRKHRVEIGIHEYEIDYGVPDYGDAASS